MQEAIAAPWVLESVYEPAVRKAAVLTLQSTNQPRELRHRIV